MQNKINSSKKNTPDNNEKIPYMKRAIEHWEIVALYLILYDVIAVNVSYFLGLWLRFDLHYGAIPKEYIIAFLEFAPIYTVVCLLVFGRLHLYSSVWRFASFTELNRVMLATIITTIFQFVGITVFFHRMPVSYYLVGAVSQFGLITVVRFSYRYINLQRNSRVQKKQSTHNIMVIGAGAAGQAILREMRNSEQISGQACCVIDDNPNKWGRYMEGVQIVGGRDDILSAVEKYDIDEIYFAIPTASPQIRRDILNICKETKCELKRLPGMYQLANGDISLSKLKPVAVEDLLGRDPIKVNMDEIFQYIKGKTILVTGGGGSIGSELCRQIAAHEPKQLIIFDVYENNAYEIEQELKRKYKDSLNLVVLIGSVRDSRRVDMVFKKYRPEIVYHAAAHKHVPLMETSPNESIKNNVIGTYKTAYAALKYGTQRFVLISTDKAVNPTNIMGASKRLCEMVIQTMDAVSKTGRMDILPLLHAHNGKDDVAIRHRSAESRKTSNIQISSVSNKNRTSTQFVAVRFGNVLGSNGSVIPLFKKQIEAGGPVTVTHPDIVRYFMTIPEAVSLVLQAGTYAWGGEIFVLDMGDPVKIDTLARNLIKLSGYEPDVDIKVTYTGVRDIIGTTRENSSIYAACVA
jgi:FlaA1/EpsC-like NDP-sugar epimerase